MKIIIFGGGKTGIYLTKRFTQEGHDVAIIEKDKDICRRINSLYDVEVINSHGIKASVFNKEKFSEYELFIGVSSVDELNIVSCSVAKKLGIPKTIARVRNEDYDLMKELLNITSFGIDLIIFPEQELAKELINLIKYPNAIDVYELFDGEVLILSTIISTDSSILNKTLTEIASNFSLNNLRAILVERLEKAFIPDGTYKIQEGDKIYSVCKQPNAETVMHIAGYSKKENSNLMINGSGKIARFLASKLSESGDFNIKVIVEDEETAQLFSEVLPEILVVFGQATDIDILAAEGIIDMDFFLALTDNDEKNIVSSLFANHLQVQKTVTRIEKTDYLPVTKTIGLRRVINSPTAVINTINKFVKHGKILSSLSLKGVNFEMATFKISSHFKYLGVRIKDLHKKLPPKNLVAVISRKNEYIIPTGMDEIFENDEVLIFTEKSYITKIEKIFGI